MTFDWMPALWLAPAAAALVFVLSTVARGSRIAYARRWSAQLEQRAASTGRWSPVVLGAVALLAGVAAAGPRWGSRVTRAETEALNVVLAVDISRSMLAEDQMPSRLERAKREARRLVQDLPGDRIGLIAFAGGSYILSPLTIDAGALQMLIDALDPDIASSGGTELARALRQAHGLLFATDDVADRVLVVFTDGETHDTLPEVLAAARRLAEDGIRLILVAQGGREPATIPVRNAEGQVVGVQRDPTDRVVETMRRDDVLAAVADAGQGVIVTAELADQASRVRDLIADYQRTPQSATVATDRVPRAWVPLLAAVVLLLGQTATRRSAALVGVLLIVCPPKGGVAQGPKNAADEAWRSGAFGRAAEAYLRQVERGEGGDTTWFNLGTAAMAIGDTAAARRALERAAASVEPEIRFRALHNLGLMALRLAMQDTAGRAEYVEAALRHYREALLLKPADRAAKWNFEIALRLRPPTPPAAPKSGGGEGSPTPDPDDAPSQSGLSRAQAEQLLRSIADTERETRRNQVERRRQALEVRGRKEW